MTNRAKQKDYRGVPPLPPLIPLPPPSQRIKLVIKPKELKHIEPGAIVDIMWHGGPQRVTFLGLGAGEMYRFADGLGNQIYVNPRSSDLKWMEAV